MAKILSIVETAYRATLEEEDDTVLWLNAAFRKSGETVAILLRNNAVNYALKGQNASGLRFGHLTQINPPHIDQDLSDLIQEGVPVYVVSEDLKIHGIHPENLIDGVRTLSKEEIPKLFEEYDHIWHW